MSETGGGGGVYTGAGAGVGAGGDVSGGGGDVSVTSSVTLGNVSVDVFDGLLPHPTATTSRKTQEIRTRAFFIAIS